MSLLIRTLTERDLSFADAFRAQAGWNQTLEDWRRFIAYEPEGCFLAEWSGTPAGTATTACYGTELAWIGMVLVHPDFRRNGIGKALLQHCLDCLDARPMRCVKLDATPQGQPLYEKLGFHAEWTLARWEARFANQLEFKAPASIRALKTSDLTAADALDVPVFGVSRRGMLERLAAQSRGFVSEANGRLNGFGFIRPGARADYLGPVVATSVEAGCALVRTLLATAQGTVFWDIPDANAPAVQLAKELGFQQQRTLLRMYRGENRHPGEPASVFALAAPEIG
ncbi:MAG: GNAT family N-acetyltransferase [Verrucomicrobiota bacterium]